MKSGYRKDTRTTVDFQHISKFRQELSSGDSQVSLKFFYWDGTWTLLELYPGRGLTTPWRVGTTNKSNGKTKFRLFAAGLFPLFDAKRAHNDDRKILDSIETS